MTKEEAKSLIVSTVERTQGCKATQVLCLVENEGDMILLARDYNVVELIAELVKERKLVEVEYILPAMNYRVKSFLLPALTKVMINSSE